MATYGCRPVQHNKPLPGATGCSPAVRIRCGACFLTGSIPRRFDSVSRKMHGTPLTYGLLRSGVGGSPVLMVFSGAVVNTV